jgi:hypothetical protein
MPNPLPRLTPQKPSRLAVLGVNYCPLCRGAGLVVKTLSAIGRSKGVAGEASTFSARIS